MSYMTGKQQLIIIYILNVYKNNGCVIWFIRMFYSHSYSIITYNRIIRSIS